MSLGLAPGLRGIPGMVRAPSIFIAGLGRCGTAMVMTMLDRGGFPVVGPAPGYEPSAMMPGSISRDFIEAARGIAVKWIDPNVARVPADVPALSIWLARDPIEQARSQLKLLGMEAPRARVRGLASLIRIDAIRARRRVASHGPVLDMRFETILADPVGEAERMREFLSASGASFDAAAAARAVLQRSPKCAADLTVEAHLLQEASLHG